MDPVLAALARFQAAKHDRVVSGVPSERLTVVRVAELRTRKSCRNTFWCDGFLVQSHGSQGRETYSFQITQSMGVWWNIASC